MTSVLFLPFRNKMSVGLICLILFSVLSIGVNSSPSFNQNQLEDWSIQSSVPTAFFSSNSSEKCAQHSREYLAALRNRLPWAVTSKLLIRTLDANPLIVLLNNEY